MNAFMEKANSVGVSLQISPLFLGREGQHLDVPQLQTLLREARDAAYDGDVSGHNVELQQTSSYMQMLVDVVPTLSSSVRQDIINNFARAATQGGGAMWLASATAYMQEAQALQTAIDDMIKRQRNGAEMAVAIGMLSEPELFADFERSTREMFENSQWGMTMRKSGPEAGSARDQAIQRAIEEGQDALHAYLESDLFNDEHKAELEDYLAEMGPLYDPQVLIDIQRVLQAYESGQINEEELEQRLGAVLERADSRGVEMRTGFYESTLAVLDENHPGMAAIIERMDIKDEHGALDASKLGDLFQENKEAVIEAMQLERRIGFEHLTPEQQSSFAIGQMHMALRVASDIQNGTLVNIMYEMGQNEELLNALENAQTVEERLDLLVEAGIIEDDPYMRGLMSNYVEPFDREATVAMSEQIRNGEYEIAQQAIASRLQEQSGSVLSTISMSYSEMRHDTDRHIALARARYPEGTALRSELEVWISDTSSLNNGQKTELFSRFANGDFANVEAARAARYQIMGEMDVQVTQARIAASRALEQYTFDSGDGPTNGHAYYYTQFEAKAHELGMTYVRFSPPSENETSQQSAARMEQNLSAAQATLAANRNANGELDTSALFMTREVRSQLLSYGVLSYDEAAEIAQNGKVVYNALRAEYLAPTAGGDMNPLLLQAARNAENNIPMERWDNDTRMAYMLREMDMNSSLQINLQQFAQGIVNSPLTAQQLQTQIAMASEGNLQQALTFLDENTDLTVATADQRLFATMGLIAVEEMGSARLIKMAYKIDSLPSEQRAEASAQMMDEIFNTVLPDGMTMEQLRNEPGRYNHLLNEIDEMVQSGQSIPTKEQIAEILGGYDAELQAQLDRWQGLAQEQGIQVDEETLEAFVTTHGDVLDRPSFGSRIVFVGGQPVQVPSNMGQVSGGDDVAETQSPATQTAHNPEQLVQDTENGLYS